MAGPPKDKKMFFDERQLQTIEDANALIASLEDRFLHGEGKAGYMLAMLLGPGLVIGSETVREDLSNKSKEQIEWLKKTYPKLLEEAESGDRQSMDLIANYYQSGWPPLDRPDVDRARYWLKKSQS